MSIYALSRRLAQNSNAVLRPSNANRWLDTLSLRFGRVVYSSFTFRVSAALHRIKRQRLQSIKTTNKKKIKN